MDEKELLEEFNKRTTLAYGSSDGFKWGERVYRAARAAYMQLRVLYRIGHRPKPNFLDWLNFTLYAYCVNSRKDEEMFYKLMPMLYTVFRQQSERSGTEELDTPREEDVPFMPKIYLMSGKQYYIFGNSYFEDASCPVDNLHIERAFGPSKAKETF